MLAQSKHYGMASNAPTGQRLHLYLGAALWICWRLEARDVLYPLCQWSTLNEHKSTFLVTCSSFLKAFANSKKKSWHKCSKNIVLKDPTGWHWNWCLGKESFLWIQSISVYFVCHCALIKYKITLNHHSKCVQNICWWPTNSIRPGCLEHDFLFA